MVPGPRILVAVVTLTAVVALAGCGGDDDGSGSGSGSSGAAFSTADLEELRQTTVAGLTSDGGEVLGRSVLIVFSRPENARGVVLHGATRLSGCDPFVCWDYDMPLGPTELDNMKKVLPRIHIDNPDLVFQTGTVDLADDKRGFATYRRSFVRTDGGHASSNGYQLLYHDGVNHISIDVYARGGPSPESDSDLLAEMTEDDARAFAIEIFSAYADRFGQND